MERSTDGLPAGSAFSQVLEMTRIEQRASVGTTGAHTWERGFPLREWPDDPTAASRYPLSVRAAARLAELARGRRRRLPRLLQGRDVRARVGHLPAVRAGGQGLPAPQRSRTPPAPGQREGQERP